MKDFESIWMWCVCMYVQKHIPGSFPDIDDFKGGIKRIGEGFSGIVFKSTLRGRNVVLKVFCVCSYPIMNTQCVRTTRFCDATRFQCVLRWFKSRPMNWSFNKHWAQVTCNCYISLRLSGVTDQIRWKTNDDVVPSMGEQAHEWRRLSNLPHGI